MIQMAADIEYLDSRKVRLPTVYPRILIELAADSPVDIAVVNEQELKEFEQSETGDDADIDWEEYVQNYEGVHEVSTVGKSYLLIWNANKERDASVAYRMSPVE
ncbi:MAG: hypothetical protein K2X87_10490 [Gemmataceae bacterium]|nr:hypothetical protein [Gemmataceae bacterium]